jgi:thioredoxin-dependent peroxiredoxin
MSIKYVDLRLSLSFKGILARALFTSIPAILVICCALGAVAETPLVGSAAPDFTLKTPQGTSVQLSTWSRGHKSALIILRGYPGYQCPYCQKQVHDFVNHAADFAAEGVPVLLVYPGAVADLGDRAKEFLASESHLPANIVLVTDPGFKVTDLYGLRWNETGETAYPSAFLLDEHRRVFFSRISTSHGDRLSAQEALEHLQKK